MKLRRLCNNNINELLTDSESDAARIVTLSSYKGMDNWAVELTTFHRAISGSRETFEYAGLKLVGRTDYYFEIEGRSLAAKTLVDEFEAGLNIAAAPVVPAIPRTLPEYDVNGNFIGGSDD